MPITLLAILTATGYVGIALLALFWVFIEVAELVRKDSRKFKHILALITLLGIFVTMVLAGYVSATYKINLNMLYVMRISMVLAALTGWFFTLSFLSQRVEVSEGDMKSVTGRPEPLVNTAIVVALALGFILIVGSFWSPVTPEVERIMIKLLAVISPLFVIYARRWVTPVSDPKINIKKYSIRSQDNLGRGLPKG